MDDTKVNEQMIKQFIANAPTEEDVDLIQEFVDTSPDQVQTLGKAEKFYVEVCHIFNILDLSIFNMARHLCRCSRFHVMNKD